MCYLISFLLYIYFIEQNIKIDLARSKINYADICLADNATTHTIYKDKKYFSHLTLGEANVNAISGTTKLIGGSRRANILLLKGTKFIIKDTLFFTKSQRNLLSFNDICLNGYHTETMKKEILNISMLHPLS